MLVSSSSSDLVPLVNLDPCWSLSVPRVGSIARPVSARVAEGLKRYTEVRSRPGDGTLLST